MSLPDEWAGQKPSKMKVKDMIYSSVLQVPGSKDSRLFLKMLSKCEQNVKGKNG